MVTYTSAAPVATWSEGRAIAKQIPDEEQYCVCAEPKLTSIISNLQELGPKQVVRIETIDQKIIDVARMLDEGVIGVPQPFIRVSQPSEGGRYPPRRKR